MTRWNRLPFLHAPGWDERSIPDQNGRTAMITGANSGIGLACARVLATAGAHVILAGRNADRLDEARHIVQTAAGYAAPAVSVMDLANPTQIQESMQRLRDDGVHLDMLILNAGIMGLEHRMDGPKGVELQLYTNVLGHILLTYAALPMLAPTARIVSVSSIAHRRATLDFQDLSGRWRYSPVQSYARSKLALLMFSLWFQRQIDLHGLAWKSIAAHPGVSRTPLFGKEKREAGRLSPQQERLHSYLMGALTQPALEGARPVLFAATDPKAEAGGYYGPDGTMELWGAPARAWIAPSALARSDQDAFMEWALAILDIAPPFLSNPAKAGLSMPHPSS